MKQELQGKLSINSRGKGFLRVENQEDDTEIAPEFLGTALHGDIVRCCYDATKRTYAVEVVLERRKNCFVGTIAINEEYSKEPLFFADDRRIHLPFKIAEGKADVGEKVFCEMFPWTDPLVAPTVKILQVIGKKGDNNTEMRAIILERGFEDAFPEAVEQEAEEIKTRALQDIKNEIPKRRDFRKTLTFTIDPDTAKDFDDAISVQKLSGGEYEIGVHIADVSHYVRPGTALDTEAQKRGVSVYLVDRTIPMLPEVLSNDLCSLNPNEEKLAFSAVFMISEDGRIKDRWIGKTIIKSDKRFTYEEAQRSIDTGGLYAEELRLLNRLAKIFTKQRVEKGVIAFDHDEVKFILDEFGRPLKVFRKEHLETHKLVEEFMLLANEGVAEYVNSLPKAKGEAPLFVYRIHDLPDEDRIGQLAVFIKALGYELPLVNGTVSGKDINALFKKIDGKAEEGIIKIATLRSLAKAIYSVQNIGHFGLASDYYTHFTSPIRRYPDTLVHRLLFEYLEGRRIPEKDFAFYEKTAAQNTESEIRATDAERESIRLKQVEFMQKKLGEVLDGTISGITEWGLYVEEKETKAEGMVHVRNLGDDFFSLDEKNYCLVGERTKKKFSLGDSVRFKITGADPERKTLDFMLVNE